MIVISLAEYFKYRNSTPSISTFETKNVSLQILSFNNVHIIPAALGSRPLNFRGKLNEHKNALQTLKPGGKGYAGMKNSPPKSSFFVKEKTTMLFQESFGLYPV